MRRAALAALVLLTGCMHGSTLVRSKSAARAEAVADSLYWNAILNLNPSNKAGSLDTAVALLDSYLSRPGKLKHLTEATTLRRLARDGQQLARVEAALQQARASAGGAGGGSESRARTDAESKSRDEEMVKEIQRLKDELAKANEELERIKKRLAAPKP